MKLIIKKKGGAKATALKEEEEEESEMKWLNDARLIQELAVARMQSEWSSGVGDCSTESECCWPYVGKSWIKEYKLRHCYYYTWLDERSHLNYNSSRVISI